MPVNNALKSLARDGRFSVADANALKQLVQSGQVSADEAQDALSRYGDIMDPEAGRLLEGFTGGSRDATTRSLPASTLARTLGPGAPPVDVTALQHGLMSLGMREQNAALTLPSGVDGIYGNETKSAVRAFQQAHGLAVTGTADPSTLRALDGALRGTGARGRTPAAPSSTTSATVARPRRGLAPAAASWQEAGAGGRASIGAKEKAHAASIAQNGIGDYYGDHGSFADAVHTGDRGAVEAQVAGMTNGKWHVTSMTHGSVTIEDVSGATKVMKESSCIGWVMDNVKAAYAAAGKSDRFAQIEKRMHETGMRGTILCEELQKDGWSAVFYSPRTAADLKSSGENDKLAALTMAEHGQHVWRAGLGGSVGVKPDAVVTGYRDTTPDAKTDAQLKRIEAAPFFVGVANGGIHTFVVHDGSVTDFHWTAPPNDDGAITEHPVRQWEWDTGLYMLPPGSWTARPASTTGNT